MHVIVVLDQENGMLFNHRRQSRDRNLRKAVLEQTRGHTLYMNAWSYRQFAEDGDAGIHVSEEGLALAGDGDYCFVENVAIAPYAQRIQSLTVYRWNRRYPADRYLDLSLTAPEWKCVERTEFAGFSHEVIQKEVYIR